MTYLIPYLDGSFQTLSPSLSTAVARHDALPHDSMVCGRDLSRDNVTSAHHENRRYIATPPWKARYVTTPTCCGAKIGCRQISGVCSASPLRNMAILVTARRQCWVWMCGDSYAMVPRAHRGDALCHSSTPAHISQTLSAGACGRTATT